MPDDIAWRSGRDYGERGYAFWKLEQELDMLLDSVERGRPKLNVAKRIHDVCLAASVARTRGAPIPADPELRAALQGKRVAIAYFGLTRSLKTTICNLYARVHYPLERHGLEVDTYLHTYELHKIVRTRRNPEEWLAPPLDPFEYQVMDATERIVTNQTAYRATVDIERFIPPRATQKYASSDTAELLWNIISQYNSLELVTDLWSKSGATYDAVLYVRPDMIWLDDFPVRTIKTLLDEHAATGEEIYVTTSWKQSEGRNDRFAVGTPAAMERFGRRIESAAEHVQQLDQSLHAERFLRDHMAHLRTGDEASHIVYRPIMEVPLLRIRAHCAHVKQGGIKKKGYKLGDAIRRKGCMIAHQDCESFPYLERQPEAQVFFPPLATVDEDPDAKLPSGRLFFRICDPRERQCKPLSWDMRSRYVVSEYTERNFVKWSQWKGFAGNIYATYRYENGSAVDWVVPPEGQGTRFIRNWTHGLPVLDPRKARKEKKTEED